MAQRISDEGLKKIAAWEGLRLHLYNDPVGYATIGYGHLVHRGRVGTNPKAEAPFADGLTASGALDLLRADVLSFEASVSAGVKRELPQHQFDALVCLAFNIGAAGFARSSLCRYIRSGGTDSGEIRTLWCLWCRAGGSVNTGLLSRRNDECAAYLAKA